MSTPIHGNPGLSTGFAVSFAVKVIEKMRCTGRWDGDEKMPRDRQKLTVDFCKPENESHDFTALVPFR
jgi:hypothetical protein